MDASLPTPISTSTYNLDDLPTNFNGAVLSYDNVGHLKGNSATGQAFVWNKLGELTSISGGTALRPSRTIRLVADVGGVRQHIEQLPLRRIGRHRHFADFRGKCAGRRSMRAPLPIGNGDHDLFDGPGGGTTSAANSSSGMTSLVTDRVGSTTALSDGKCHHNAVRIQPIGPCDDERRQFCESIQSLGQQADPTGLMYSPIGGYFAPALMLNLGDRPSVRLWVVAAVAARVRGPATTAATEATVIGAMAGQVVMVVETLLHRSRRRTLVPRTEVGPAAVLVAEVVDRTVNRPTGPRIATSGLPDRSGLLLAGTWRHELRLDASTCRCAARN